MYLTRLPEWKAATKLRMSIKLPKSINNVTTALLLFNQPKAESQWNAQKSNAFPHDTHYAARYQRHFITVLHPFSVIFLSTIIIISMAFV